MERAARFFAGVALIAVVSGVAGCKRRKPAGWSQVWLGPSEACGLQTTGDLLCWGANDTGQLGDRSTTARATSKPKRDLLSAGLGP